MDKPKDKQLNEYEIGFLLATCEEVIKSIEEGWNQPKVETETI